MLRDDTIRRLGEIDAELTKIGSYKTPTRHQADYCEALVDEAERLRADLLEAEEREAQIFAAYSKAKSEGRVIPGASFHFAPRPTAAEVFDPGHRPASDCLRALDIAAEARASATGSSADINPRLRPLIEAHPAVADRLRMASAPAYVTAFGKLIGAGDPSAALLRMTDSERNAFAGLAEVESRTSLALADANGGYAVPALLDPSVIYTGSGSANSMRSVARIVHGIDDTWRGVTSAGITASWDSEAVEVSDDGPTLGQASVVSHKASAFVPYSIEIEGDWTGLAAEMSALFAEAKDTLETAAFATGSGTADNPTGILTDLFAASSTVGVLPTTDGQFGAVDVRNVFAALGARYRPNASFMSSVDVMSEVRGFDTTGGMSGQTVNLTAPYSFPLLGRPYVENSGFPDFTGTTGAANILVCGDFRNYVIFDRSIGMRVEVVNHLLGSGRRPNGQRGLYAWWRVGGKTVNAAAFRLLLNA